MDLTFAEQVKIVLGRKNMTIKQLAGEIQEKTGQKMSRQNLTQRLGRDNFQEKDMRMIAEILGCPFQLNILDTVEETDGERLLEIRKKAKLRAEKKEKAAIERSLESDVTVGDMLDIIESVEQPGYTFAQETEAEETRPERTSLQEPEHASLQEAEAKAEEPEHTSVQEAEAKAAEPEHASVQEAEAKAAEPEHTSVQEAEVKAAEPERASVREAQAKAAEPERASVQEAKPRPAEYASARRVSPERGQERLSTWNRREEKLRRRKETHPHGDWIGATPQSRSRDFMKDANAVGEINPYTGKEYETNSVRMHPRRIGYIQVYDRGNHKWADMTEWAFYGFQEQKKAILGPDYDEPVYLD